MGKLSEMHDSRFVNIGICQNDAEFQSLQQVCDRIDPMLTPLSLPHENLQIHMPGLHYE